MRGTGRDGSPSKPNTHMVCPPCDNWSTVRSEEEKEEEEEKKEEEEKERKLSLTAIKCLYMCNGVTHLVSILIRCEFECLLADDKANI